MNNLKIDLIIPVWNTPKVILTNCLNSVVKNFKGNQCILIDDGSTDGSADICDSFKLKYPKLFKVIHKENEGNSIARNLGIQTSNADYIMFLDCDDLLVNNDEIYNTNYSLNWYKFIYIENNKFKYSYYPVWNTLYKLDTIKALNIHFPTFKSGYNPGEDWYFNLSLEIKLNQPPIKMISVIMERIIREDSLGNKIKKDKNFYLNEYDTLFRLYNEMKSSYSPLNIGMHRLLNKMERNLENYKSTLKETNSVKSI